MDNETRIKLLEAGYTKEEIEAGEKKPETETETDPETGIEKTKFKKSDEQGDVGSENESEVNYKEMFEKLTSSVDSLKKTVEAIQDKNKDSADSGSVKKDTVLDTINSFIDTM